NRAVTPEAESDQHVVRGVRAAILNEYAGTRALADRRNAVDVNTTRIERVRAGPTTVDPPVEAVREVATAGLLTAADPASTHLNTARGEPVRTLVERGNRAIQPVNMNALEPRRRVAAVEYHVLVRRGADDRVVAEPWYTGAARTSVREAPV